MTKIYKSWSRCLLFSKIINIVFQSFWNLYVINQRKLVNIPSIPIIWFSWLFVCKPSTQRSKSNRILLALCLSSGVHGWGTPLSKSTEEKLLALVIARADSAILGKVFSLTAFLEILTYTNGQLKSTDSTDW